MLVQNRVNYPVVALAQLLSRWFQVPLKEGLKSQTPLGRRYSHTHINTAEQFHINYVQMGFLEYLLSNTLI